MKIFELNLFWFTISPTYYGLMYALWFIIWYQIIKKRWYFKNTHLDDLLFYIFIWVVVGWRLGYVIFYNFTYYLNDLLSIIKVWEGWMSFHGWVIWVIIAMYLFSIKYKINFLNVTDEVTSILPIWLWLWRLWNYLNKELLWFTPYNWFLAVEKQWLYYFPSPLLEAFLEWVVLYMILYYFYKYKKFSWQVASLFLVFYWLFRLLVEIFFRQPDSHIWYIYTYFTVWELLTLPMIFIGVYLLYVLKNKKNESTI